MWSFIDFFAIMQVTARGLLHTRTHTVLTPADDENHIDKHQFKAPFVCGARNLGEALRRLAEGAAMIRTKGEAGTGEGGDRVQCWLYGANEWTCNGNKFPWQQNNLMQL